MASYRLLVCYDPGDPLLAEFYVNNHTNPLYDLSQYSNGTVLRLTLPPALTGLTYSVITCVTLNYLLSYPSAIDYDLGTVVDFGGFGCTRCMDAYDVTGCGTNPTTYTIATQNKLLATYFANCPTTCNGCQPSLNITLPGSPPVTLPTSGCYVPGQSTDEPYNIDLYDPTFILTCGTNTCLVCNSTCYRVDFCQLGLPFIIITNPTITGNPTIVLNTVVEASIIITQGSGPAITLTGCLTITQLDTCNAIGETYPILQPTEVIFDTPPVTHLNCSECFPQPGFLLRRCDDPGISFIASNDLSAVVGKVISGVKITNCTSTGSICSSVKLEQCWEVFYNELPGDFDIQYINVLANCDCCPGPCN